MSSHTTTRQINFQDQIYDRSFLFDSYLILSRQLFENKDNINLSNIFERLAEGFDCEAVLWGQFDNGKSRVKLGWFDKNINLKNGELFEPPEELFEEISRRKPYTLGRKPENLGYLYDKGIRSICSVPFDKDNRTGFLAFCNNRYGMPFTSYHEVVFFDLAIKLSALTFVRPRRREDLIYLENEARLMRDYPGQYAWIVGENILVFPNQYELSKAILESGKGKKGYTVKIEECEPPVYDVPSPEVC